MHMSTSSQSASITVIVTNDPANGGNINFGMLGFLQGNLLPGGYPPIVQNTLESGNTGTILESLSYGIYSNGPFGSLNDPSPCSGTATFYMPDSTPVNISWDLDAWNGGPVPIITTGPGYALNGVNNPQISGNNYTFNITISPQ